MKLLLALALLVAGATSAAADSTAAYLDRRAEAWIRKPPRIANVACAISCHTTFPYLLARRHLGPPDPAIRAAFEARLPDMIAKRAMPYYGKRRTPRAHQSHVTEAVLTAIALVADDRASGLADDPRGDHDLRRITRDAIDHAWSLQGRDGSFDWLDFDIEPWESSTDWGNAMAMLLPAPRGAPEDPRAKLFTHLRRRLASKRLRLHDRATLLWTSRGSALLDDTQRTEITDAVLHAQRADGGFAIAPRADGKKPTASDGYSTALGVLALCGDAGRAAEVRRGLQWLRDHRAADGSFPGRSAAHGTRRADGYATDAATAYATLALATCKR